MERDFTYRAYKQLITSAKTHGYEILTVREYLSRDQLPEKVLVMRHDIDRKVNNALDMARIEAAAGISSTYYFRTIDKVFNPEILVEVSNLGHEVGYHYEDLDTENGDLRGACHSFRDNLEQFREYVPVDTVSMHGNPLTPHDNRDIWRELQLETNDLIGEVYMSVDFSDVVYFSDTNRTWYDEKTIVNDWPVGPSEKPMQITSTRDLIDLVEEQSLPRLYLLVHPNRWADSYVEWILEYLKDTAINGAKWGLWASRSLRGQKQPSDNNV